MGEQARRKLHRPASTYTNTRVYTEYTLTSFYIIFSTHYEDKIIPFRIPMDPLIFKSSYVVRHSQILFYYTLLRTPHTRRHGTCMWCTHLVFAVCIWAQHNSGDVLLMMETVSGLCATRPVSTNPINIIILLSFGWPRGLQHTSVLTANNYGLWFVWCKYSNNCGRHKKPLWLLWFHWLERMLLLYHRAKT